MQSSKHFQFCDFPFSRAGLAALCCLCALPLLSGCSSVLKQGKPAQFYLLEPPRDVSANLVAGTRIWPPADASDADSRGRFPKILVRNVDFPDFLARPQMVIRYPGNEVFFEEYHRWAEMPQAGFKRVLRHGLIESLGAPFVAPEESSMGSSADWVLSVDVLDFSWHIATEEVVLEVQWMLEPPIGEEGLSDFYAFSGEYRAAAPAVAGGPDHSAIALALSGLIFELAEGVAVDFNDLR